MLEPDIVLGPGDTDPTLRLILLSPRTQTGVAGRPMDLWGKTVVFRYQLRSSPAQAWINRTGTVIQTGPAPVAPALDPYQGVVDIDWLATGGPVAPGGNAAAINYNARCVVTGGGRQESFPNGDDKPQPDGSNPAFLWMQVSRDFVIGVTPPPVPPAKLSGWFTVDTVAALKAVVSGVYQPGSTFFVVRESNRAARLDGTSGLPEDLNDGPFATSDDPTLQWFYL